MEPTTRSRTRLFLSLREPSFPPSRWKGKARAEDDDEEQGLLADQPEADDSASRLPPRWIDTVDSVETILEHLGPKVTKLEKLHAKHARPGFKDRSAEEAEIQRQTGLITDEFRRCQSLLQSLAPPPAASQDRLLTNIRMGLATKLQDASSAFRKKQSNYLRQLKGFEVRQSDLRAAAGDASLRNQYNAVEDDLQLLDTATAAPQNSSADARISEIDTIATSITELADLFRDLSTMVIDQGTLLDRVDYNVEQMAIHAEGATQELKQAASYQRQSGRKACIFLLILIILSLVVVIAMKSK